MPTALLARSKTRPGLGRRWLFGLAFACTVKARAALWESPLWALSGQATATIGYDSNLFAINDGAGDAFAQFRPSLILSRKDSLLDFDTEVWNNWTGFLRETANDSSDPGISMKLSYPANVSTLPTEYAEVHWIRTTEADTDVGQRVSQDDLLAKYEGDLFDFAKTSILGRFSFNRDEYLGAAFSTNETGSAGATAAYSLNDLFKAGVGYDLTVGRSEANASGLAALDQTEQGVTFQMEGEFTPKVTGKASVGAAFSDYTGAFVRSEWDTVASAAVSWEPRDRLVIELEAQRAPSFNTDGNIDLASTLRLGIRQELPNGFAVSADINGGRTSYEPSTPDRTDTIEGAGAGLDYNLTGKLTVSVAYSWTRQNSDIMQFTYRRQLVTGRMVYKF
jgi:opacity protein-like surface antigen